MGRLFSIKIDSDSSGKSIKDILKEKLKMSNSLIIYLKKDQDAVLLNGSHADVVKTVCEGDVLDVNVKAGKTEYIIKSPMPLNILWEDEDILCVNKPYGMTVHPTRNYIDNTFLNAVMYYLQNGDRVHIITRLDRETSGIVLIAKNPWSAAVLGRDMKNKKLKKEYIAVVNGMLEPLKGVISAPIKKREEKGILRQISDDGKEAVTEYEVIKENDKFSLVKLFPITGRTHQLRVHLSHIGHPIYGDSMYNAPQINERTRLHHHKLTFIHPLTNEEVLVIAPEPEDFSGIL